MGVENIKLEPMDVYLGEDKMQVQSIVCLPDTAAATLNNKYFFFYDSAGVKRYAWFNTGAGTDPAIAGYTAHEVTITALATASAVATALTAVLTAVTGFDATASGYTVTLTATAIGYATPAHDAQATAGKTGFAFNTITVGDTYEKMGYIDGDISVANFGGSFVDITTHQTGADIIGKIKNGSGSPEMSFSLKEVTADIFKKVFKYTGGTYLPVGGSNVLSGAGSGGKFQSPQYTRCVLHPVRLDISDKTNDLCMWRSLIQPDQITFSGENVLTLPVKITGFEDTSKPKYISTFCYGDWSQSLT